MKLIGAWLNPKTGEVRVVWKLKSDYNVVVKLFRVDQELHSVKFWFGNLEKTMSFWNTTNPITDAKVIEEARKRVLLLMGLLKSKSL